MADELSPRVDPYALLRELQDERRNTENKSIQLTGFYLNLIAISTSFFLGSSFLGKPAPPMIRAWFSLFAASISLLVYALQRWYRMWKNHYVAVSRSITPSLGIPAPNLPIWLRSSVARTRRGQIKALESWLQLFTLGISIIYFLAATWDFWWNVGKGVHWGARVAGSAVSVVVAGVIFLLLELGLRRKGQEINTPVTESGEGPIPALAPSELEPSESDQTGEDGVSNDRGGAV